MIYAKIRRSEKNYIVRIPAEEIERRVLTDGDLVAVEIRRAAIRPKLRPALRALAEESWQKHEHAYRALAEI